MYAACQAIGPKVGVGAESLCRWVLQAQVDASERPGATSAEQQRIRDLEREVRDLKEANVILGPKQTVHDVDDTLFKVPGSALWDRLSSVSVTCPGLRVQPVVMRFGDLESWTLVDRDAAVVEPVEAFLSHLHAVERSPNTVKAYAHDLRDWFEFVDERGLEWTRVRLEDVGRFVAWLRLPGTARAGNVAALPALESVCTEATVNRKLSAISAFYEFHQRHGVDLGVLLTTWQPRGTRGGSRRSRPRVIGCGTGFCSPC